MGKGERVKESSIIKFIFNKGTIFLNILAIPIMFWEGFWGVTLMAILIPLTFLHLFYFNTFKKKLIIASVDLISIVVALFVLVVFIEGGVLKGFLFLLWLEYILPVIIVVLVNWIIHGIIKWIYSKLKNLWNGWGNKVLKNKVEKFTTKRNIFILVVVVVGLYFASTFLVGLYHGMMFDRALDNVEDREIQIILNGHACLGNCPIYNFVILGNGSAYYNESRPNERFLIGTVEKGDIDSLLSEFREMDYLNLKDKYWGSRFFYITDLGSSSTSLVLGDIEHSVYQYGRHGPDSLFKLRVHLRNVKDGFIESVGGNEING